MSANLLKKGDFARLVGVTPARISQLVGQGLPVEPDGLIDEEKAKAWLDRRRAHVAARITPEAPAPRAEGPKADSLHDQLLIEKIRREAATASLTVVKVGERQGELGKIAEFRVEQRKISEAHREGFLEFCRSAAVSVAGRFGLDLGDVQTYLVELGRNHARKQAAWAKAEAERLEAGA